MITTWRRLLYAARPSRWRLPSSREGTEAGIALAFAAARAATLAQVIPAIPESLHRSPRPALDGALLVVAIGLPVLMIIRSIRQRHLPSRRWVAADVALSCVTLLAEPLYTLSADRVGTWAVWAPGLSVAAAIFVGVAFTKRWMAALLASLLSVSYAIVTLPATPRSATVVANCLSYLAFAAAASLIIGYLRRLGDEADRSRVTAAVVAREEEGGRNRQLVHDAAYLLKMLSSEGTDPALASALRCHAATLANELYSFLGRDSSPASPPVGDPVTLTEVVQAASTAFDDLPISYVLRLAPVRPLAPETAAATGKALHTLLINVRRHAHASRVTVHADSDPDAGTWELAIADDGKGFDPDVTTFGFGLGQQVIAGLEQVDVTTQIRSAPGAGTIITLTGACAAA